VSESLNSIRFGDCFDRALGSDAVVFVVALDRVRDGELAAANRDGEAAARVRDGELAATDRDGEAAARVRDGEFELP
jgi:hypothetical protein